MKLLIYALFCDESVAEYRMYTVQQKPAQVDCTVYVRVVQTSVKVKKKKSLISGFPMGDMYYIMSPLPPPPPRTRYTVKKVSNFPTPSRDLTNQTLPGRE